LAVDEKDGSLYVTTLVHTIRKIFKGSMTKNKMGKGWGRGRAAYTVVKGTVTTFSGRDAGFMDGHASIASFNHPRGITVDRDSALYVADGLNYKIRKIYTDGRYKHRTS